MKQIALLGSTGSIGKSTLDVIRHFPDTFKVYALTTNSNIKLLEKQAREFKPRYVCVSDPADAKRLKRGVPAATKIMVGVEGLREIVSRKEVDRILLAISGSAALVPLMEGIRHGKEIALANKEALVMAGSLLMDAAVRHHAKLLPIDSEQSAIWQCLEGEDRSKLRRIYLTASGGPFRKATLAQLKTISVDRALAHPRWKMGRKITVDSATLMNKGLELLEAMFLFNAAASEIEVVIHPEAIIHSMVEFVDGVVLAQLSATDMRIPIQYALAYPERLVNTMPRVDFCTLREMHFEAPDCKRFPCLALAYRAAKRLGTLPAVLNAANEVCVEEFLKHRLTFMAIPRVIEKVMDAHRAINTPTLEEIMESDSWARNKAVQIIGG